MDGEYAELARSLLLLSRVSGTWLSDGESRLARCFPAEYSAFQIVIWLTWMRLSNIVRTLLSYGKRTKLLVCLQAYLCRFLSRPRATISHLAPSWKQFMHGGPDSITLHLTFLSWQAWHAIAALFLPLRRRSGFGICGADCSGETGARGARGLGVIRVISKCVEDVTIWRYFYFLVMGCQWMLS